MYAPLTLVITGRTLNAHAEGDPAMAENDDHRIVSRDDDNGTRHIAIVRRAPDTDHLTDNEIITSLEEWRAKRQQPEPERWPMPASFGDWLKTTKPGPPDPCPICLCWSLRLAPVPDNPGEERAVCTMLRCEASPFYRAGTV